MIEVQQVAWDIHTREWDITNFASRSVGAEKAETLVVKAGIEAEVLSLIRYINNLS